MSAYTKRKHVSREVEEFDDLPTDKSIVRIVCGKGNNLHLVQTDNGEEYLASMPTKFRKYVWVKRGDFVLVEPIEEGDKVKAEISHVLLKTHIKQLKKEGKWPKEFDDEENVKEEESRTIDDNDLPAEDEEQYSSDESLNLEENPNHANYAEEASDSDSNDSSEDEEQNSEELDAKNA